jgi:hypothetical protein
MGRSIEEVGRIPAPMSEVEEPGVELLTDAELAAVVRVVRALVDHDEVVLRDVGAYEHGDPYEETHHWRLWDHVDLVMPPGDPRTWRMRVIRVPTAHGVALDVEMWTEQEGRSELTLQMEMRVDADGGPLATFAHLHVL